MNRYTLAGLCAIILWSGTVALLRSISEQFGPLTGGGLAYLTGGIVSTINLFFKDKAFRLIKEVPRKYLLGCGGLFLIYTVSLFLAIGLSDNRGQSIELGLINHLWTPFTILFSIFILSVKADYRLIPGTLMALSGVFFIVSNSGFISFDSFIANIASNPTAYILAFTAAVSWGLYSNLARLWGDPNSIGVVPLFILITGAILTITGLLDARQNEFEIIAVAEVIALGLSNVFACIFWDIAMQKGDAILVASCSYFIPFLSTVVSCIYLKVLPDINVWIGCVFITAGSILSRLSVTKRKEYYKK